jgi:hypothetical protein
MADPLKANSDARDSDSGLMAANKVIELKRAVSHMMNMAILMEWTTNLVAP